MAVPTIHSEMLHVSCTGIHNRLTDSGESSAQGEAGSERELLCYSTAECGKGKASQEDGKIEKEVEKKGVYFVVQDRSFAQ